VAWLELHQSLPTHRKTLMMADALDVKPVQIVGHLTCLWLWALDNAQDGVLHVSPQMIARAAQWEGDPQVFMDALLAAGFLDHDGRIHDWDEYAHFGQRRGKSPLRRAWEAMAKRMRPVVFARDGYQCVRCGATQPLEADHKLALERGGSNDLTNLQTLCRPCNRKKGAKR
jgi:hypothetical protein